MSYKEYLKEGNNVKCLVDYCSNGEMLFVRTGMIVSLNGNEYAIREKGKGFYEEECYKIKWEFWYGCEEHPICPCYIGEDGKSNMIDSPLEIIAEGYVAYLISRLKYNYDEKVFFLDIQSNDIERYYEYPNDLSGLSEQQREKKMYKHYYQLLQTEISSKMIVGYKSILCNQLVKCINEQRDKFQKKLENETAKHVTFDALVKDTNIIEGLKSIIRISEPGKKGKAKSKDIAEFLNRCMINGKLEFAPPKLLFRLIRDRFLDEYPKIIKLNHSGVEKYLIQDKETFEEERRKKSNE